MIINSFRGEFFWLSNFANCKIHYDDNYYSTVEHAYQAAKTEIQKEKVWIKEAATPGEAKRRGQLIKVRQGWEQLKLNVMSTLIKNKFFYNEEFKILLLATGDSQLIEGNHWGDKFWGICKGEGLNHLGRILMDVREELKKEYELKDLGPFPVESGPRQLAQQLAQRGAQAMGLYSNVKDAKVSKSGQYLKPGNYKIRLKAVKEQDAQIGGGSWFIIEMVVVTSDNPEIKEGGEYSQALDSTNVMFLPNVKRFVAAVSGVNPNSETINEEVEAYWQGVMGTYTPFDKICELITDDSNPLGNIEMNVECIEITTKQEKKPFTKHLWQPREGI